MVHMTGMAGFVHAYYVLDLRHAEGWIGWGGRITGRASRRSRSRARRETSCRATQVQDVDGVLARYEFVFTQEGTLVYEGDQTALLAADPGRGVSSHGATGFAGATTSEPAPVVGPHAEERVVLGDTRAP